MMPDQPNFRHAHVDPYLMVTSYRDTLFQWEASFFRKLSSRFIRRDVRNIRLNLVVWVWPCRFLTGLSVLSAEFGS